jgi:ribosome-associated toxin RatA of RatAB toxin-antitoxin module
MIKVRHEAIIHKPVGEVFDFVTDVSRFHEWVTGAVSNRVISEEPLSVGTTFEQTGEFMGRRFEMQVSVTYFEQDHRFSYKSLTGPMPFEQHYRFEPEGQDTRLTVVVVGETKGFLRLLGGVAERVYQLQLEGDLERLEKALGDDNS